VGCLVMEVKRYNPTIETEPYTEQESAGMEEYKYGEYIKLEDYEALHEELLRVKLELETWQWGTNNEIGY
jgi:hypothetical protein